jgi:hypothetical protein
MPETVTEQSAAPQAQEVGEKSQAAPTSEPMQGAHVGGGGHGGAYTLFRELTAASGAQEPPPDKLSPLFRKSEFSHPVNDAQKARALAALQQQYGNRYVQRVLSPGARAQTNLHAGTTLQRQETQGASGEVSPASAPPIERTGGQPLDSRTQDFMGSRFNQDFGGVRVHDDSQAQRAAKALNAEAFTTGRDIYFNQGAYNPASSSGQKLIAHELAHVVQQGQGLSDAAPRGFSVSHPSDPLERQADAASEAVMRGEMFPSLTSSASPVLHRLASGGGAAPAPSVAPTPTAATTTPNRAADGATGGAAAASDFSVNVAGTNIVLPVKALLNKALPGSKLTLPDTYLKKVPSIPAFKLTKASLDLNDNKMPTGATLDVAVNVSPLVGEGTLSVDRDGNVSGSVHVIFRSDNIPGLKQTELDARVTKNDFAFDASIDFDLPKVTGNLKYKYQDHKHSGKGTAQYEGSKMKGSLEIIMSEVGLISGSGMLEMELFKGLKGEVAVAVDERRNIAVKGKLSVPGQIDLFPEKKYEKSFFSFEKKFPIWGITIPVIDVNVGIFAEVHAGAGFRAKFGPGVLRDIALTGEFGTDPEAATEFGLGGEFYVPAAAEIVANVGGGIGLGLAIADITGGIEAVGVAGLYTALSVRPNFKYSGGKYTISGMAELAGVAQLKFGINAFAKIDVGVWMFKGTVWRKDWTLAEWIWNTGLNIALRANISYTLGEDFAPDINFETGQVLDPEKFIKDAMPESGAPVPAPVKQPVPEKATLTAEGAQGTQDASAAPTDGPPTPTADSPSAKTQKGTDAAQKGGTDGTKPADGAATTEKPAELDHDTAWKMGVAGVTQEVRQLEKDGKGDQATIQHLLPAWKTRFGFTELVLDKTPEGLTIEGAMSAKQKVVVLGDDGIELHQGEFICNDATGAKARAELDKISMSQLPAIPNEDRLKRYKYSTADKGGGYVVYLKNKKDGEKVQWPFTYLDGRSRRKRGKESEDHWIKESGIPGASKNEESYKVVMGGVEKEFIPDIITENVVADVKDVKEQSLTEQLSAFYVIAKQLDPHTFERKIAIGPGGTKMEKPLLFGLIYRGKDHSEGPTALSDPLKKAINLPLDIITDEAEA